MTLYLIHIIRRSWRRPANVNTCPWRCTNTLLEAMVLAWVDLESLRLSGPRITRDGLVKCKKHCGKAPFS
ncbi:hypothetical protein SODG_000703 [Sodalis praecaptivus]